MIKTANERTGHAESDSRERRQALTTIAEISETFDTLRKTFTFPAGPPEHDPHSSTPHLAYNARDSVVYVEGERKGQTGDRTRDFPNSRRVL